MRKEMLSEINEILINISGALNVERSTVFVVNNETERLESLISQGFQNNLISMQLDCGVAGIVAKSGLPKIINDPYGNESFNPHFDSITGFKTKKILCVPILNDSQQVVGVLQSLNKIDDLFNEKDLAILQCFAEMVALALKNSNLYTSTEAIKQDIANLLSVSTAINSELDLTNLIQLIMEQASKITESDRSSFFIYDEEEEVLWTKFGEGLGTGIIKTDKGLAGFVAKTKRPLIENNPYQNPRFDKSFDIEMNYLTNNIISVPVFNGSGKLLGVIQSMNKKNGDFTNKDLFILNGFASQISIAVQNSTLFQEINEVRNYLDILFENLDSGILTIDENGIIKTANKRFCNIIGTDPKNIVGRFYKNLDQKYFSFLDNSDYTFRSGEKFRKNHVESLSLNDQKLIFNFNALPMKSKSGKHLGVINVIQDITSEERLRENLNRYLPQHVISEIINKDDLSVFNGKYKRCSILFSDIRKFTSLTEALDPKAVVKFLNDYFDIMVDTVSQNNGVIDKLIGDAIMATFGIPYKSKKDASNAAMTALQMIKNVEVLNEEKNQYDQLKIGIGIATGEVISGNIGSKKRFEYTVIGDAVNLASRLESLTKFYDQNILICESTYQDIAQHFLCREIDNIRVKGKKRPVKIYSILNKIEQKISNKMKVFLDLYEKGLKAYRHQEFNQAIQYFSRALFLNSKDKPAQVLLERSRDFIISPPEKSWGGTWVFSSK